MHANDRTYSATELARFTDASYRQIDYWCRLGLLEGDVHDLGSGHQRSFAARELVVVAVLATLSDLGLPLGRIGARVARWVRASDADELHGQWFVDPHGLVSKQPLRSGWCIDLDELFAPADMRSMLHGD